MEPIELVEVKLSFLATRGEDEPPDREGMVTSGGAGEGGTVAAGDKPLGVDKEIDTTPSP